MQQVALLLFFWPSVDIFPREFKNWDIQNWLLFFWPSVDMFPREFKNWDIQNWVQIYQSVQSGVGKLSCNKTALKPALAPKLFGTEKLLPCHRPRMRRSSFPNYQRVGMLTCSKVPRFQPRLERRGTDCQCWHTFPPFLIITIIIIMQHSTRHASAIKMANRRRK